MLILLKISLFNGEGVQVCVRVAVPPMGAIRVKRVRRWDGGWGINSAACRCHSNEWEKMQTNEF